MIQNKNTICTIPIPIHVHVIIFVACPVTSNGGFPPQKKRIILDECVSLNQLTGIRKPFAKNDQWTQQVLCTETWQLLFRFGTEYHFYTESDDCEYIWLGQDDPTMLLSMVSSTGPNHLRFSADSKKDKHNYFSPTINLCSLQ